jgi:hypothetical protein
MVMVADIFFVLSAREVAVVIVVAGFGTTAGAM